jgi:rhodanese-related sulfurtransferase
MTKKILFKTSVVLIFSFLLACNKSENIQNVQLKQISSKELKEKIAKQEEEFTLIDLRSEEKFHKEKIEGAVNIPVDSLESKISDEAFWQNEYMYPPEDSSQIIVYGANEQAGVKAAQLLHKMGYKNVLYLKGGYDKYNIKRDKLM